MNFFIKPLTICALFLMLIVVKCNDNSKSDKNEEDEEDEDEIEFNKIRTILNGIIANNETINGVLVPIKEVGCGGMGIVYEGRYLETVDGKVCRKEVAIKIGIHNESFEAECSILMQLKADFKYPEEVEVYGIPGIYYNGTLNNHYPIMAMTLLDQDLSELNYFRLLAENQIRIFYQLISTLRFMHSRLVIHNDIKLVNIMMKKDKIFLIDYNVAQNMNKRREENEVWIGGTEKYLSIAALCGLNRYYMDDLKTLYYTLLRLDHIEMPWHNLTDFGEIAKQKLNRTLVRGLCDQLSNDGLKKLYKYLHDTVHDPYPKNIENVVEDKRIPDHPAYLNKALKAIEDLGAPKCTEFKWEIELAVQLPISLNSNSSKHAKLEKEINEIAKKNGKIDDRIQPNKKLWDSNHHVHWLSMLYAENGDAVTEVELRIHEDDDWITREYGFYKIMNAKYEPNIETYGIQKVYFNSVSEHKIIAFTLCKERLMDRKEISPVNILRVMYQAILTLKYVHSKGIVHQTLEPKNFLIRGSRLFLTGFEYAEINRIRSADSPCQINLIYGSQCTTLGRHGSFMDDFKSLFYVILHFLGIKLPWEHLTDKNEIVKLKMNYKQNANLCSQISDPIVQNLLKRYYKYVTLVYKDESAMIKVKADLRRPFYTAMGNLVMDGIEEITQTKDPYFDWPTDIPKIPIATFESIESPKQQPINIHKQLDG